MKQYLCLVRLKEKVFSIFLFSIYFLAALHQSILHPHSSGTDSLYQPKILHHHEDFKDVHHEHRFHVGIFHFIGHLFENVNHPNDHADEHVIITQQALSKIVVSYNRTVYFYAKGNNLVVYSLDAESLPDPPSYRLFLSHRLNQPNTPLRAPPAFV